MLDDVNDGELPECQLGNLLLARDIGNGEFWILIVSFTKKGLPSVIYIQKKRFFFFKLSYVFMFYEFDIQQK